MTSLIPSRTELNIFKDICKQAVNTGFLPAAVNTPEKALIIAMKGRELRIPPMQAFSQIAVINGKPSCGAELQLALIYRERPGAQIIPLERTAKVARLKARRSKEDEWTPFEFTWEDAVRAGLSSKDVWKKYPKNMLYWRCVSDMARTMFPDCLMGMSHTPEELGAEVDEDGSVIDIPATPTPEPSQEQRANTEANSEPSKPKAEPGTYQGTEDQQHKLQTALIANAVDEALWNDIHEAMIGKRSTDLRTIIQEVKARHKPPIEIIQPEISDDEIPFGPSK